jgi:hypothetical protein
MTAPGKVGTVKMFDPGRGFVFISCADGNEVYFHATGIESGTVLAPNVKAKAPAAVRGNFMCLNFFPSGSHMHARDWPFSNITCVSRAHRSELIPCIRLRIREIALTAENPQRWARRFFPSALILTRHAPTAPCRGRTVCINANPPQSCF